MALPGDTAKTFVTQGKFIHPTDSRTLDAHARVLRAEAVRRAARTVSSTMRAWLTRFATGTPSVGAA